jgi:hypothetical protein
MGTNNPLQFELLNLFGYLSSINSKHYCFPSQAKICEILESSYKVKKSTRSLRRYLVRLCSAGLIERRRRIKSLPSGEISFQTSLYFLTKKAYKYLAGCLHNLKKCGIYIKERAKKLINKPSRDNPQGDPVGKEEVLQFLRLARERLRDN